jgi:integrase
MISLLNGCSRSEFVITPNAWEYDPIKAAEKQSQKTIEVTVRDLLKKEWRIDYRYYDPAFQGTKLWGKQIVVKGMNKYKSLHDRQEYVRSLVEDLTSYLDDQFYNPITKKFLLPETNGIDPNTGLSSALKEAHKLLKCSPGTKDDIEHALVHIQAAITDLRYTNKPVCEIKIRDCILVLNKVRERKNRKREYDKALLTADFKARKVERGKYAKEMQKIESRGFGAASFNHYRSYLLMLFKEIIPLANLAGNPVKDIAKEKVIKRVKDVLTDKQRPLVNEYLKKKYYEYWRFLQIFFHSGARITEMLRVEPRHVDLANQRFKCLILKGAGYEEVWKVIKTIALPYWQEAINDAAELKANGRTVYLFSRNQKPGFVMINEEQVGRRWNERIMHKPELGNVTATFYSLKHLNSTETTTIAGTAAAAAQNSHKSEAMVVSIYDVKSKERAWQEQERLKEVNNPFA